MKKRIKQCLLIIGIINFIVCNARSQLIKPWTVLVYMVAQNDNVSDALLSIREMMRVGSSDILNILVYVTIIEKNKIKKTKKLYIEHDDVFAVGPTLQRDAGDIVTLMEALQWAALDYPSEYSAVIIWDHAINNKKSEINILGGICYDRKTEHYLSDYDFLNVLSWMRDHVRYGKPYDIIIFDTSFCATLEIAYTLSSCARYCVASQNVIAVDDYQYDVLLKPLRDTLFTADDFINWVINSYNQEYSEKSFNSLSIINLEKMELLADNINSLAYILSSQLNSEHMENTKPLIEESENRKICCSFDEDRYIDLGCFYNNLLKNSSRFAFSPLLLIKFQNLLQSGLDLLFSLVKKQTMHKDDNSMSGLSLYFPSRFSGDLMFAYPGLYWNKKKINWMNFLETIFLTNL